MTLRTKGFNIEIYGLAKNLFLKEMAKHFAALFGNVTVQISGQFVSPWTHPYVSHHILHSENC